MPDAHRLLASFGNFADVEGPTTLFSLDEVFDFLTLFLGVLSTFTLKTASCYQYAAQASCTSNCKGLYLLSECFFLAGALRWTAAGSPSRNSARFSSS